MSDLKARREEILRAGRERANQLRAEKGLPPLPESGSPAAAAASPPPAESAPPPAAEAPEPAEAAVAAAAPAPPAVAAVAAGGAAVAVAPRPAPAPAPARPVADVKVLTYPDLVYREMLALLVVSVVFMIISVILMSPLEGKANPAVTPNPSKAPWYFLGLQELLSRFPPVTAGVVLPTIIVGGICTMGYIDRNPSRQPSERKVAIIIWTGFLVLSVAFVMIGVLFRGLEFRWFWDGLAGRPL